MAMLVATPAIVLPGVTSDAQQFAFICAFFAAALVFIEYFSAYPSILEFRFAPPFNRIRFAAAFFSVFAILQTVGVNLLPGWSHSRVFLLLAVIAAVIGGNALV